MKICFHDKSPDIHRHRKDTETVFMLLFSDSRRQVIVAHI